MWSLRRSLQQRVPIISIERVPETSASVDLFEDSLIVPIPGQDKNSIVLEARDGANVQRLKALNVLTRWGADTVKYTDVEIDIFITDARIAFACSRYAPFRGRRTMLVGQMRYPWISVVGWSSPKLVFRRARKALTIEGKGEGDVDIALYLVLPEHVDAESAATEIARRAAVYRLASDPELDDEERARLEELKHAEPALAESLPLKRRYGVGTFGILWFFGMPNCFLTSEASARLLPRTAAAASSDDVAKSV